MTDTVDQIRPVLDRLKQQVKRIYGPRFRQMILYGSFARNFAVSRGYYAMFYAAEVALLSEGLAFSKHASVIAAFGQRFARTGRVPAYLHRYLLDAFDIRQIGDYDAPGMVSRDRAGQVMVWAREFFRAVADWLGPRTQAAEGSIPDVFR